MTPWIRLTFFLPVTGVNERTAYLRVLNEIRSHPDIGGFTTTTADPAVFLGWYWSRVQQAWVDDDIVLLFIDRPGSAGDAESAAGKLAAHVKTRMTAIYAEEGARQEEVWSTAEQIYLF